MAWRIFTFLATAFWLVMTFLLVRVTYYPEGSQFAKLPPGKIFRVFMDRGISGDQLQVFHGDQKVGYASFSPRRLNSNRDQPSPDFDLTFSLTLDKGAVQFVDSRVHLDVTVHNSADKNGMIGHVRFDDIGTTIDFDWPEGASMPKFKLHSKTGDVDDTMLRMFAPQMFGANGAVTPPPGVNLPEGAENPIQVKAREGIMSIAGQRRHGYVMEFTLMDQYHAKAFFTEAGELALVEMPEGWRAMHQFIYNLDPAVPDTDQ